MHPGKLRLISHLRGGQGTGGESGKNEMNANDVQMRDVDSLGVPGQEDEYVPEDPTIQEYFWEAAKVGEENTIESLVKDGAEVNAHDPSFGGWTAMHYAAQNGKWRAISTLIKLGARVSSLPNCPSACLGEPYH